VKSLTNLYESKLNLSTHNLQANSNANIVNNNAKVFAENSKSVYKNKASSVVQPQQQQPPSSYSTTSTTSSLSSQKPIPFNHNQTHSLDLNNNNQFISRSLGAFNPHAASSNHQFNGDKNSNESRASTLLNSNVEITSFNVKNVIKLLEDVGQSSANKSESIFRTNTNDPGQQSAASEFNSRPKRSSSIDNVISILGSESSARHTSNTGKKSSNITSQKSPQDVNTNSQNINKLLESLSKSLNKKKPGDGDLHPAAKSLHKNSNPSAYLELNNLDDYDINQKVGNLASAYNIVSQMRNNNESSANDSNDNTNFSKHNNSFNVVPKPPPGQPPTGYHHRLRRFRANASTTGNGPSSAQSSSSSAVTNQIDGDTELAKTDNTVYKKLLDEIDNKYNNQYQNKTKLF
jgi:hypothetical protein